MNYQGIEGAHLAEPKLQVLPDTGQQQDIWEQFQRESYIESVAGARGLEQDQLLITMNICKQSCLSKGVCCVTHRGTLQHPQGDYFIFMFYYYLLIQFLFSLGEIARLEGILGGMGR